jgi:aminopeptidase
MSKPLATKLGYNESAIHVDMISTTDRTVTATLESGEQKVIYKSGQFTI